MKDATARIIGFFIALGLALTGVLIVDVLWAFWDVMNAN